LLLWAHASASAGWYSIQNFDVAIQLEEDGYMSVQEDIVVNFEEYRHGLYRTLPLQYSVSGYSYNIFVSDVWVAWYEYLNEWWRPQTRIRIWSADRTVFGEQTYPISYTTYWAVRQFSWYDEFYRNIIGTERDVPIPWWDVSIAFPVEFDQSYLVDRFIYYWDYGQRQSIEDVTITQSGIFFQLPALQAYQWLTFWAKFVSWWFVLDPDMQAWLIRTDMTTQRLSSIVFTWRWLQQIWWLSLVVIVLLLLYVFVVAKWFFSRNKKYWRNKRTIIPQYTPPKWLCAAEVWTLIDDVIHPHDITATLYERAASWYIKIIDNSTKLFFFSNPSFDLKKIKPLPDSAPKFQTMLFDKLFATRDTFTLKLSILFRSYVQSAIGALNTHIVSQKRFTHTDLLQKPFFKTGQVMIVICGIVVYVLFWFLSLFYNDIVVLSPWIVVVYLSWFVAFFALFFFLKEKEVFTSQWKILYDHVAGYKLFLQQVEKDKLQAFLDQDPLYFDKVLPFAVVLWVQDTFLKKITPLLKEVPSWYVWNTSLNAFSRALATQTSYTNQAATYTPSSWHSSGGSSFSWWGSSGWFSGGWGWWGWWWSW